MGEGHSIHTLNGKLHLKANARANSCLRHWQLSAQEGLIPYSQWKNRWTAWCLSLGPTISMEVYKQSQNLPWHMGISICRTITEKKYGPGGSLYCNTQLGYDHCVKIPLRIKQLSKSGFLTFSASKTWGIQSTPWGSTATAPWQWFPTIRSHCSRIPSQIIVWQLVPEIRFENAPLCTLCVLLQRELGMWGTLSPWPRFSDFTSYKVFQLVLLPVDPPPFRSEMETPSKACPSESNLRNKQMADYVLIEYAGHVFMPNTDYPRPTFTGHGHVGCNACLPHCIFSLVKKGMTSFYLSCFDAPQWSRKTVPKCHRSFSYISLPINTGPRAPSQRNSNLADQQQKSSNAQLWYSSLGYWCSFSVHSCIFTITEMYQYREWQPTYCNGSKKMFPSWKSF